MASGPNVTLDENELCYQMTEEMLRRKKNDNSWNICMQSKSPFRKQKQKKNILTLGAVSSYGRYLLCCAQRGEKIYKKYLKHVPPFIDFSSNLICGYLLVKSVTTNVKNDL